MTDSSSWHSYPQVFNLGHRALKELFLDPVVVEEKLDGSQFSWGQFPDESGDMVLKARSKGAVLNLIAPEKMFLKAIETIQDLALHPGWTYRAEYFQKPKHNALAYDRVPKGHLMIFDINTGEEEYLNHPAKLEEADRLGLEVAPLLYEGMIHDPAMLRELLDRTSILGGQKIEGVVIKNVSRFGPDKKALMGKFVSEAYKEVHSAEWKRANPGSGDIVDTIVQHLRTPARWNKAIQHVRDAGLLEDSPRDIGLLLKEVHADIDKEMLEYISEWLMAWAVPKVKRGVAAGLPNFYKEELMKKQFEDRAGDATI